MKNKQRFLSCFMAALMMLSLGTVAFASSTDVPDASSSEPVITTEAPTTDAPATDAPVTEAPETDLPQTTGEEVNPNTGSTPNWPVMLLIIATGAGAIFYTQDKKLALN